MKKLKTIHRIAQQTLGDAGEIRSARQLVSIVVAVVAGVSSSAAFAEGEGVDPLGEIGTVATDSITLVFNVIGAILVLVGLLMFIGSAINISRGRSTAGELMLMFVVAGALVLIGIAFVAFGLTQTAAIGGDGG